MNIPRQFSLMNGNGEELDLLTTSLFLYKPEGLGYTRDDEYRRAGSRWILVNTHLEQNPISGKLLFFTEDPYARYFEFIKFTQVAPLVLIYQPNPLTSKVYRRLVRISKLEKSDINKEGYLECPIDFTPLAPWYRPFSDSNTSTWWDWHWIIGRDEDSIKWYKSPGFLTIESDSHMDSPCRIKMYGPLTNPGWRHYVNDELFADGTVYVTVEQGQYLMVDNTEDPYKIVICDSSTDEIISNVYQKSGFTTERFINLQYGTNSIRYAGSTAGATNMMTVEGMIYYESV